MQHPPPLVPVRPAQEDEIPRTAKSLIKKAASLGWVTSATYAKGTTLPARGQEVGKVVASVVVRIELVQAGSRATAVWVDGKFDTAFRWAHWLTNEQVGSRELGKWIDAVSDLLIGEVPA
ncbi:hypothetical protein GCM10027053_51680 [Intrasporangium mesophilum]